MHVPVIATVTAASILIFAMNVAFMFPRVQTKTLSPPAEPAPITQSRPPLRTCEERNTAETRYHGTVLRAPIPWVQGHRITWGQDV
jgi:hypothetical protein